jgi:hypothetical protein
MVTFLLERYKNGEWEPFAVWSNMPNIRPAMDRMNMLCKQRKIPLDRIRIKPMHLQSEIDDMRTLLKTRRASNSEE